MIGDNMKNKKIILIITIILLIVTLTFTFLITKKNNLIKINYNEVISKIENKETFVLCVSASECMHCNDYKPKLKKIANEYDIKVYHVNVDEFNDNDYKTFKKKLSFDGSTPITIFFKEGTEKTTATRIEGNVKSEKIIDKLKSNGYIIE